MFYCDVCNKPLPSDFLSVKLEERLPNSIVGQRIKNNDFDYYKLRFCSAECLINYSDGSVGGL